MSAAAENVNGKLNGHGELVDERFDAPASASAIVPAPVPMLMVTPTVKASELVARLDLIKEAMETAMVEGVDYGRIPGTEKPTLLKPGAEKLGVLFQLDVQLSNEKVWGPGEHLTVVSRATVYHAPSGARLGFGEGLCTTREKKYAKRHAELQCPACSKPNVRRSKHVEEFYCWAKTGGCGAKFAVTDQRITGQTAGEIENPDLPDSWNTAVKIGAKRARVDAVLAVTGASAIFTQDVEDQAPPEDPDPEPEGQVEVKPLLPQPTARPAKPSERAANAAQKVMIQKKAAAAGLEPSALANIILIAAGDEPRTWDNEQAAAQTLKRLIDRLPARLVTAVKKAIEIS